LVKIIKISVFAACILLISQAALLRAEKQTKYYGNYHFIYNKRDSIYVERLVSKIQDPLERIERFFQHRPKSVLTIILTRSQAEYDRYRMNKIPEWSQAVAFTEKKIIVLKIESAENVIRSPEILLHEIVHIFFAETSSPERIPVWMHEGIAQYLSGYELTIDDRIRLANALVSDNIISLTEMDTLFHFNQVKARLAYIESLTAIQFIIKQHGVDALKSLIQNVQMNMTLNQAFLDALGYDFIDFKINWYEELESQNKWLILLNFENILWISIVILFILALFVVKMRNRKFRKSWDEETEFPE